MSPESIFLYFYVVLIFFSILFIAYGVLMLYYWSSWRAIGEYTEQLVTPGLHVSVIIPARNEEASIGLLLNALQDQSYPRDLVEIIVIDDHSTDQTASIARQFSDVTLISLDEDLINSYKKKAIATGVAASKGDLIITTDADCIPGTNWIAKLVSYKIRNNSVFIAAPVVFDCNSSLVEVFQAMDFMMLQGITGAASRAGQLSMCNGANLAYEKKAFMAVNGFSGIDKIASGDDMLLMHKMVKQFPGKVGYVKALDAIVTTSAMKTWKEFINQRIRWASKATYYDDYRIRIVLVFVYCINLCFPVLLIAGFFNSTYWIFLLAIWIFKTLAELPLFISVAKFFNKGWSIKWLFPFQPLHIAYMILSGFLGQLGKYEWKGRVVR